MNYIIHTSGKDNQEISYMKSVKGAFSIEGTYSFASTIVF
jgi:hypothetical protein